MLQVADEVVLDGQVALIDRGDERQIVHALEHRPVRVVGDGAAGVAVAQTRDRRPGPVLGHFLDGEVEFVAGDEVHHRAFDQAEVRLDRDLGPDQPGLEAGVLGLQRLDHLHVRLERRGGGVEHHQIVVLGDLDHLGQTLAMRRRVDQPAALDHGGGLGQPGGIPERLDLALGLVAGAGAAVETVERGSLEEKCAKHADILRRKKLAVGSDL